MGKSQKTNAMRILERNNISFEAYQYVSNEENTDGTLVARKNNRDVSLVHKTLVVRNVKNELYVFVIPITKELDLKKAAMAAGEKKLEMLPHKYLHKYTGYIKGGCSPLGMKKNYPTFIESKSQQQENLIVSGGKKGYIIEVAISDLLKVTSGQLRDVCKE